MDTADKIKFLRTEVVKMDMTTFAKKLNVSRLTIHNWETGINKPTPNHVMLISLLCYVSTDYLIFEDEPYNLSAYGLNEKGYKVLESVIDYFLYENKKREIQYDK